MSSDVQLFLETCTKIDELSKSEKSKIVLVYSNITRLVYVVKYLKNDDLDKLYALYKNLQTLHCKLIPKISYLYRDDVQLIVIEEFINGRALADLLMEQKDFSDEKIKDILLQLCKGLSFLHKKDIIHQDIKPSNILLTNDDVLKLIDFDVARTYKYDQKYNTQYFGTKGYAAPEQYGWGQTDNRSDIYALGNTIQMLKPKSNLLRRIVYKALQFDPDNRYQSVNEIIAEVNGEYRYCFKELPLNEIEIMLKDKINLFKPKIPETKDYMFNKNDIDVSFPISLVNSYDFETQQEALQVAMEEFEQLMFSNMDTYIMDVLDYYKAHHLKKYCVYQSIDTNYYYSVNKKVEKLIEEVEGRFKLKFPDYIKIFEFIPEYTNFAGSEDRANFHLWQLKHIEKTNYVAEIKLNFFNRTMADTTQRFIAYADEFLQTTIDIGENRIIKMKDGKKVVDTAYHFNIDKVCIKFMEEILNSTQKVLQNSSDLRGDVEGLIQKSYLPELKKALEKKTQEILYFLKRNNSIEKAY